VSLLTKHLYKTNKPIHRACKELDITFEEEDLEDLEQCSHCNIWYHGYELVPDLDDNNICKFCEGRYGR
jgi:hypothetical protein